jgi:hypothetical protein
VDVAAAGALVVVAAEGAADGTVVAGWVAETLDAAVVAAAAELVVDPPELVPGVHPESAAAIARHESIAASSGRTPDPVSMAGRYSRAGSLSAG